MHTEIPAGLSSYPTKSGQLYRFAGILRGSTATEFTNALTIAGMALQTVSADTWPEENLPPLSDGETYVRGEGKWTSPSAMPTGFQLPGGSASIFQLWEFTPQALEKASVTAPNTAASSGSYGLGLGLVVLGVLAAGALVISSRKENPSSIEVYPTKTGFQALVTLPNGAVATFVRPTREEALKAARTALRRMSNPEASALTRRQIDEAIRQGKNLATHQIRDRNGREMNHEQAAHFFIENLGMRHEMADIAAITYSRSWTAHRRGNRLENPIRYVRTVRYRGVPVHVHFDDVTERYTVDFVVAGQHIHAEAGRDENQAIVHAQWKIDAILGRLQPQSPKVYPSPWS